jgi:tetraacyldisaccharide 4'-kinase
LLEVDTVLLNGKACDASWLPPGKTHPMTLRPVAWRHVQTGKLIPLHELELKNAIAMAGIGNPGRFFSTLQLLGFDGPTQSFADHHAFTPADFSAAGDDAVLMTEKDAVKVRSFAADKWWALVVEAEIPDTALADLLHSLGTSHYC